MVDPLELIFRRPVSSEKCEKCEWNEIFFSVVLNIDYWKEHNCKNKHHVLCTVFHNFGMQEVIIFPAILKKIYFTHKQKSEEVVKHMILPYLKK
jgi:hypothetical protein